MQKKSNHRRVIIVDDEPAAISNLREVIDAFDALEVIAEIGDGSTAIMEIRRHAPDVVFLDIEMPEVGGFDVARATADMDYQLVFVTAYDHYALDAFGTNAIDYLVKPVRPALLEKCIRKILRLEDV
ncbi:MAG: response regulator, partial [Wenzhouxiangella sp.]|nr:response regulator [Wenzhouxiangella sp.]